MHANGDLVPDCNGVHRGASLDKGAVAHHDDVVRMDA